MARVRVFHWKATEAAPLLALLRRAGHMVDYDVAFAAYRDARANPPTAFVIDLTRLPASGREVAVALRGSKATRTVPIVFLDGEAEKVARIRQLMPDAVYTTRANVASALKAAIAHPPAEPVVPIRMMDRFGHRSVVQKLGIGKGALVAVIDPPPGYMNALDALPDGAQVIEDAAGAGATITLWFFHDLAAFHGSLRALRTTAAGGRVWVLWRKNKRDGLDGNLIRRALVEIGLVDYKICAYDEAWSGMAISIKKV